MEEELIKEISAVKLQNQMLFAELQKVHQLLTKLVVPKEIPKFINSDEVAEILQCSVSTVHKFGNEIIKHIPRVKGKWKGYRYERDKVIQYRDSFANEGFTKKRKVF